MAASTTRPKLQMTLGFGLLEHLGFNLYSSIPAVLSELVANAWDADATSVTIQLDVVGQKITIKDNGLGMTRDEVNSKFLSVGRKKRDAGDTVTPTGRRVMGRKGIGKLSVRDREHD